MNVEARQAAAVPSLEGKVADAEWRTRVDLAAAYRLVARYGWDDLVFTHISARVPGREHHFLINPYGMMFEEMTASSLVKIDIEGSKVGGEPAGRSIRPASTFTVPSMRAREDAHCVMHLHTLNGVADRARRWRSAHLAAVDFRARKSGIPRLRGRGAERC